MFTAALQKITPANTLLTSDHNMLIKIAPNPRPKSSKQESFQVIAKVPSLFSQQVKVNQPKSITYSDHHLPGSGRSYSQRLYPEQSPYLPENENNSHIEVAIGHITAVVVIKSLATVVMIRHKTMLLSTKMACSFRNMANVKVISTQRTGAASCRNQQGQSMQ